MKQNRPVKSGVSTRPPTTQEQTVTRTVPCPECHQECAWCSWYVKNARGAGCGSQSKRKCEKGEALRGTVCGLCGGTEQVQATTTYQRVIQ